MSGERLYLSLKQMEKSYMDQHRREYEITKNISLLINNPLALITLKETGKCILELPEALFDADYPGHYMRRIKSVSITIPSVVGPYTSINCTLTLLSNKTRIKSNAQSKYPEDLVNPDNRFFTNFAAMQAIATSTAQNDSGMFELNFRDERYFPFEGAGAVSRWRIDLPKDCNAFDFDTISDVILRLNYTAREGGEILKSAAKESMLAAINKAEQSKLFRLFSLKHEFPSDWPRFLHPTDPIANQTITHSLSLNLGWDRFSFLFRGKQITIDSITMFLKIKDDFTYQDNPKKLKIHLNNNEGVDFTLAGSPVEKLPFAEVKALKITIPTQITLEIQGDELPTTVDAQTSWWQKVLINGVSLSKLKPEAIDDIWLSCHYSVNFPESK